MRRVAATSLRRRAGNRQSGDFMRPKDEYMCVIYNDLELTCHSEADADAAANVT